jgi:guanylate kinase
VSDAKTTAGFRVVVLSGPSGSGKTTIVERLLHEAPMRLVKSVSATTRSPRAGEVDGDAYYFLSLEDFQARRERGEFLETAEVYQGL